MKRCLDLSLAALMLASLLPLILLVALLVRIRLGRPILFRQTRTGWQGRPFSLLKFRTMTDHRDAHGTLLADHARLIPFGRFLRATSLDELPQLWNVLRGDMSLVGPRPLLPEYTARYTATQRRRLEVPPGITGWAQIHGRNAVSWEAKFDRDVWYVDHGNLWLDLQILFRTGWRVIRRDGISAANHETMPEFLGSAPQRDGLVAVSTNVCTRGFSCLPK
jgi:lipopolysaccharide/colanic/teichoic acid biosynthesis glycosyltransferase